MEAPLLEHKDRLVRTLARLEEIERRAKVVTELYPTIAGTSILIRDANRHVSRNQWDEIADAVWELDKALKLTT